MLKRRTYCVVLLMAMALAYPANAHAANMRESVVKVFVTKNQMDFYKPWQSTGSKSITGSGCVISGNRILTNAHVVSDHTFIQVRKESDPKKYTATLQAIGHDCDLAVLKVNDPHFFDGIKPFEIGKLPQLEDTVTVLGFPRGGDKLSITQGVVSRVEIVSYTQSAKKLLGVQIDAAINPGNSGGPVIFQGKLIGIAMQLLSSSQNIGYMIPVPIITHFLNDLNDGEYQGFPTLGIEFFNTENDMLRKYYQITNEEGGVVVSQVVPFSPAYGVLKEDDVILSADGINVGVDGTYSFRDNERLIFSHLINEKQVGDIINLKIVRDGKIMQQRIEMTPYVNLVPYPNYFEKPPYYIYGDMIFTVLSTDLLKSWGNKWWERAPIDFLNYLIGLESLNEKEKKEIVVLLNVLPDDISKGYHNLRNEVIAQVNGEEIRSFKQFVEILESNKRDYVIFQTDYKLNIILDSKGIESINSDILKRNNIPQQYSEDISNWIINN